MIFHSLLVLWGIYKNVYKTIDRKREKGSTNGLMWYRPSIQNLNSWNGELVLQDLSVPSSAD